MRVLVAGLAALLALAGQAVAEDSGIQVEQPWARATPGSVKTGAVYFTIENKGAAPDRLLSLSSPVAGSATLHEMQMEGNIMKMRPLGSVTIAPGKSIELKPSGNHVMLEGLKQPLKEGEHFPLTLNFEKAGPQQVEVAVGKVGAMGPPGTAMDRGAMDHMDHMNMAH